MAGLTAGDVGYGTKRVWTDAVTDVNDSDVNGVGALRWQGTKCYKYVQYDTGAGPVAAVAGNVCYYYGVDGYELSKVTSDLSDSIGIGAGVLQSAPTDGQYCWVQIRGAATVNTALTAGADGDALCADGSTDGTLDVAAAATDVIVAFATDISEKKILCNFPF